MNRETTTLDSLLQRCTDGFGSNLFGSQDRTRAPLPCTDDVSTCLIVYINCLSILSPKGIKGNREINSHCIKDACSYKCSIEWDRRY
jgi:hypothetical protein